MHKLAWSVLGSLLLATAAATGASVLLSPEAPPYIGPPAVEWVDGSSARYIAHRGALTHAPENTLAAFALATAWGAEFVELDVQQSADGTLWIMHDRTVDRTTDGSGRFTEMTDAQIRELDAGSWFGPEFTGQSVPTLAEVLEWAKGRVKVYLDVKNGDLHEIVRVINEAGMRDRVFVWFREDERSAAFRRIDQTIPMKMNVETMQEIRDAADIYKAQFVELADGLISEEAVSLAERLGMRAKMYSNTPNAELMRRALEAGVELYNIDHPHVLAEVEREWMSSR